MTAEVAVTPSAAGRGELLEACARHADALAGQVEAAGAAVAVQLRQLNRCEVRKAYVSGEWVASTLRVVAGSLGELHTVLDELAADPGSEVQ